MTIQELEKRIREMEDKIKTLENNKFDDVSMGSLKLAFVSYFFSKFNVKRLLLTVGQATDPSIEGEIVYHATTPSIKAYVGGAVKTFTLT